MAEPTARERMWSHVGGVEQERILAIETKARQAFAANLTFLNLASPTTAQNAAQIKLLTRETNGLLRLMLGDFTDASDT